MLIDCLAQATTRSFFTADSPQSMTVDQVLAPYIYVFYAAFLVSYLLTPLMRQVALYWNIIDKPDLIRKMHDSPVAYLGGIAVAMGWIGGLAISQFLVSHRVEATRTHIRWPLSILAAAGTIVLLGLWDDIKKASPLLKILVQVGAACLLLHARIGTTCTAPLLTPVLSRVAIYLHWSVPFYDGLIFVTSSLVTIGLVVGCCNASNLMDGLDGLCGGVTALISMGFVFLAVHMATIGDLASNTNVEGMRVVLSLALLGGILGFLPYNFNPASIFLGDTGSMFMGFSCATLLVMMAEVRPKWFLAALVMYALPVLDTALAFARRWVKGRPLFSADRYHFHHQIMMRGFNVKQTVLIAYATTLCFVILGAGIVFMRTRYVVAFYLVVFGSIVVAAFKMGLVHETRKVAEPTELAKGDAITVEQFGARGASMEVADPVKSVL